MKKLIFAILTIFCLLLSTLCLATPIQLDSIAAIVNDNVITVSQLDRRVAQIKQQLQQQKIKLPPDNILAKQVLQMMINQNLQNQTAKRLNISISSADVNRAIKNIAAEQQLSTAQFFQSLRKKGISENTFRQQLKRQLREDKLLRETIAAQIKVTPQEVDEGVKMALSQAGKHNEYHLLHILVPLPDSPTPAQIETAKAKAKKIVSELHNGGNFKNIAAAESSGQQNFNGGDMGWKTIAELPTVFAQAITAMHKGQISPPIQTSNGFHIIKLIGIRGKSLNVSKTQLKRQVQAMIFQRKLQQKQQAWIEQLRASAYIKILYKPETLPTPV